MTAPYRRTNPALPETQPTYPLHQPHQTHQPHQPRRLPSVPALPDHTAAQVPQISEVVTGTLDAPEVQASVRYWNGVFARRHEARAHELRRAAQDIGMEIASMEADAGRDWQEYTDLKAIRGGRPHPKAEYEGRYTWLKRHIPDLERRIAHARGDWTRALSEARRHEDSAVRLRAAALAEMHG